MVRGALDKDRAAPRRRDVLDEGVLLLAQSVLEDEPRSAKHVRGRQLLDRVDGDAAAGEDQALHVAPLGAAQRQDAVFGERVERERVDPLLVHQNEASSFAAVGAADLVFEVDDLLDALVGRRLVVVVEGGEREAFRKWLFPLSRRTREKKEEKLDGKKRKKKTTTHPLRRHQLLPLLRARVEEPGVDLGPLVLEADVGRQDVDGAARSFALTSSLTSSTSRTRVFALIVLARLEPLGHVRVPRAVVKDEAADEARVAVELVLLS